MKVLVTGGLGYIGSHTTVKLLEEGFDVVIIDNLSNSKIDVLDRIEQIAKKRPRFYNFDVQNKESLESVFVSEKPEAIIHFAGFKAVGESCQKPLMYYENNLLSTFALLDMMQKYPKCKNFVFSSSATVYGEPDSVPLTENSPIKQATSPYGQTKIMIEEILTDFSKVQKVNIAILRYFNPIGAHQSGLLGEDPNGLPNNLFPYINKVAVGALPKLNIFGNDYKTCDGTGVRDYIHVLDLAKGHVLALKKLEKDCGLFVCNLGTGKGTSVLELVKAYEKANNIKIPYEFAPRRAGDIDENFAGTEKAKKELGFVCDYTILDACRDGYNFQTQELKRMKDKK
ncbi:MAG: UDP-glucose 4-epimerase GalE [Clostridia bacterium]|nr:UDP-glucose 4-epimerase GalE [Clostridia bacterium]